VQPGIPVIVLIAFASVGYAASTLNIQADEFLITSRPYRRILLPTSSDWQGRTAKPVLRFHGGRSCSQSEPSRPTSPLVWAARSLRTTLQATL